MRRDVHIFVIVIIATLLVGAAWLLTGTFAFYLVTLYLGVIVGIITASDGR